jgi:type I restriction enzyme M protein
MDDMDAEAEEMGGARNFFAGEFEKYGWAKLMGAGLGGFEVLNLYAEAITRMNENPGVPALFRDIFKNAYLPYRDPETLRSFLKIINDFTYEHSERLGDAFEYLLSVLGSQGEAGQFRTPRHIIDFRVDLSDPQKGDSILDPACGTAGFLISAYKHILAANAQDGRPGARLAPDERARLIQNIRGYDISPDMVRLSLVNLYLHGFTAPHIAEYDTLTSDERWNEYADVIMANPPFMSPKGGIRPHKRFSVPSNRSEVLFVDYIAEHLTANGRAAVVVPEGVIFQTGTAYKALRKLLVEAGYLVGVISLPTGVFNPYSGVKTSILWLDKTLAKKSDHILFAKIQADGFDLGAQRRPVKQNDLPAALQAMTDYKAHLASGQAFDPDGYADVTLVEKARVAASGKYNLSGERYRKARIGANAKYPLVEIMEICAFEYGKPLKQEDRVQGEYPVFGSNGIVGYHNEFLVQAPFLVVGRKGSAGEVHYSERNGYPIDTTFYVRLENEDRIMLKYLYHILKSLDLKGVNVQSGVPGLNRNDAYKIPIPLPPLDVQAQIVAEINGYQKIIDGARQVLEHYAPRIEIDPAWPVVALGEVCEIKSGGTPSRREAKYWNGSIPWVGSTVCKDSFITEAGEFITEKGLQESSAKIFSAGTTLIALVGATIGKTGFLTFDCCTNQNVAGLYPCDKEKLDTKFLFYISRTLYPNFLSLGEAKFRMANLSFVREQKIPLPDLATQERLVAQIEREQALVRANRELVELFEAKIKARIARVWGEE